MQPTRTFSPALTAFMERERLPAAMLDTIQNVHAPLAEHIAARAKGYAQPYLVGICGAQGSGKSTLTGVLYELLTEAGLVTAVMSLDDFYLGRAARAQLARDVHPLLATRGVPGTHDVALCERTFDALRGSDSVPIPSFDKAIDDCRPAADWPRVEAPAAVIVFEGWCVGAQAQEESALREPVNELERRDDPDGIWRRYVNAQLATRYRSLFERIDELVLLQAPTFETVFEWRAEQEGKLRDRVERAGGDASKVMDEPALQRFIAHYERITRHIMREMPARADVLIELDANRRAVWRA